MKRRWKWTTMAMVTAMVLVGFGHWSFAAENLDWKRMKRDLGIMEAVLGKLLHQNNMEFGGDSGGRGMYFDGYGVVFLVDQDRGLHGVHKVRHVIKKKIIKRHDGSVEEEMAKPEEDEIRENQKGELKERCVEFFGNYADAIGQLKDSDRITVLLDQKSDHSGYAKALSFFPKSLDVHRMVEEVKGLSDLSELIVKGEHGPRKMRIQIKMPDSIHGDEDVDVGVTAPLDMAFFGGKAKMIAGERKMNLSGRVMKMKRMPAYEASVTRGDVLAYTSGKIDDKTFRSRVQFKERKTEPAMARKVDIMAGIMDRVLNDRSKDRDTHVSVATKGFYHKGLGAVFIAKPKSGVHLIVRHRGGKSQAKVKVRDVVKDNAIEALADYGHSLRALEPSEHIVVQVEFSGGHDSPGQAESQLTLKVRKKDVDDYNRGKIDLNKFREQVEVLAM